MSDVTVSSFQVRNYVSKPRLEVINEETRTKKKRKRKTLVDPTFVIDFQSIFGMMGRQNGRLRSFHGPAVFNRRNYFFYCSVFFFGRIIALFLMNSHLNLFRSLVPGKRK